jgi:hypothetical protein
MGKGRTFELSLSNDISNKTDNTIDSTTSGYSGNSSSGVADVIVLWENHGCGHAAYVEAKKRDGKGGNRTIVMDGSSGDDSGLDELQTLVSGAPSWATVAMAVNWPRRELVTLDAEKLLSHLQGETSYPDAERHGARLTDVDNISMVMPTLDDWESATAGEADWRKLCVDVGVPEYKL